MEIHLHTIALEPARWTPRRVSRPLAELLPEIAGTGVASLEIYEPHLSMAPDEAALPALLAEHGLRPAILSSYLPLSPAMADDTRFAALADELEARVRRFGFPAVRLFAGQNVRPEDEAAIARVRERVQTLADRLPETAFLLETHDGSIADSPERVLALVDEIARPGVGLLYQPVVFDPEKALAQFNLQRRAIRHLHLQDRNASGRMVRIGEGVVPWREILAVHGPDGTASLEFIPGGIGEDADYRVALAEAVADIAKARTFCRP